MRVVTEASAVARAAGGGPLRRGVEGMGRLQRLDARNQGMDRRQRLGFRRGSVADSAASSWLRRLVRSSRYAAWANVPPRRAS